METERALEAMVFVLVALAGGWAALTCRRARQHGTPAGDVRAWTLVAGLFLALACARLLEAGPWLGAVMRRLARSSGLYAGRRPVQIAATVGLAAFAVAALSVGVRSFWEALKRYRLAAAAVAVIVSSALIRFVSLHEVDAWDRDRPWIRIAIDLGTSALAITAALLRVRQVGRPPGRAGAR